MSEPSWELLGGGGVSGGPIDYIGNWSAGVTYQPGQVVRYNGIDYLSVNPSTGQIPPPAVSGMPPVVNGQWIKGVGGAMVWSAIGSADVGAQPFVKLHQSAPQTSWTSPGWLAIAYNTIDVNIGGGFVWQSPGYLLCQLAGTYLFVAHSAFSATTTGSMYGVFTKGVGALDSPWGGDPNGRVQFGPLTTGTDCRIPTMTALFQCAAGDFVVPWLYFTGTGGQTSGGEGQTAITAVRVST